MITHTDSQSIQILPETTAMSNAFLNFSWKKFDPNRSMDYDGDMGYTVDALETYAFCPRKYKFRYIEHATRYITYRELFCLAHRKAVHFLLSELKAGNQITPEDYYDLWITEWDSRKSAVGLWYKNAAKTYPEKAKLQAPAIINKDWPIPDAVDVTTKCHFGIPYGPDVTVQVDFTREDTYGLIRFYNRSMSASKLDTSFVATAIQALNPDRDLTVIGIAHTGRTHFTRIVRERLFKYPTRRAIASILDQISGIESESFPRCHPSMQHCASEFCGFWRVCTHSPPKK